MPIYKVMDRETGESYLVKAQYSAEACERLGWLIGNCYVQLLRGTQRFLSETPGLPPAPDRKPRTQGG
jgi:hypothetical protein